MSGHRYDAERSSFGSSESYLEARVAHIILLEKAMKQILEEVEDLENMSGGVRQNIEKIIGDIGFAYVKD